MAKNFGNKTTVNVELSASHRQEAVAVVSQGVSIPELGLKLTFELEADGGVIMLVRGYAGMLPPHAPEPDGDTLQVIPVAGNTVGIRLRRSVL